MKAILKNPYWAGAVAVFLLHQLLQYGLNVSLPVVDDYLDPFLSMPILLGGVLMERRYLFGVPRLTWLDVTVITLVSAFVFEYVFPRFQPRFVTDYLDFLAYGLGAGYFWYLINPTPATEPTAR